MFKWKCSWMMSIVWASIECPLRSNADELLLIGTELIVDTGSADTILLGGSGMVESLGRIEYQGLSFREARASRPVVIEGCSAPLLVPRAHEAEMLGGRPMGKGILGLGREKLGDSMLFSPELAAWNTLSIQVAPTGGGMLILKDANLRPVKPTLTLNSMYYWSTDLNEIHIGTFPVKPTRKTAVIFDTGSNYFGISPGLYETVTEALLKDDCHPQLTLTVKSTTGEHVKLSYNSNIYAQDPAPELRYGTCSLAIGKIDQRNFGDLANHDIVIIGTRGLKGKTLNIHKSSKNEYGFLISIN